MNCEIDGSCIGFCVVLTQLMSSAEEYIDLFYVCKIVIVVATTVIYSCIGMELTRKNISECNVNGVAQYAVVVSGNLCFI